MGNGICWTCKDCGKEIQLTYLGTTRPNTEWVFNECDRGEHGEIVRYLVSDECPVEVDVAKSANIYFCPECRGLFEYWSLHIWTGDGFVFQSYDGLRDCPNGCESYLEGPYWGGRALEVIEEYEPYICPRCGHEASLRRSEYVT